MKPEGGKNARLRRAPHQSKRRANPHAHAACEETMKQRKKLWISKRDFLWQPAYLSRERPSGRE